MIYLGNKKWLGKNDGSEFTAPLTYYINKTGGKNWLDASRKYKTTYSISSGTIDFIDYTFKKLDQILAIDFKKVNSQQEGVLDIYNVNMY